MVALLSLAACQEAGLSPEREKEVTEVVRTYYAKTSIGGGFSVSGVRADGAHVQADLRMSDEEQICGFRMADRDRRDLVFSMACPFAEDGVWEALGPDVDLRLAVSCRGEEFDKHSCRRVHRKGSRTAYEEETIAPPVSDQSMDPKDINMRGIRASNGDGVPKDEARARDLFTQASVQGFSPAHANLAMHLSDAEDVNDAIAGYAWAILASRSDDKFASSIGTNVSEDYLARLNPKQQAKSLGLADGWVIGENITASGR